MNIKEINGPWKKGIVLDKHVLKSEYLGDNEYGRPMFVTKRSDIGQALFLLKYRKDWLISKPLSRILFIVIMSFFSIAVTNLSKSA